MKLKKSIIVIWFTIIFSDIAYLFWHNQFVYSLCTPVPKNYQMVNCGDKIVIPQKAQLKKTAYSFCTTLYMHGSGFSQNIKLNERIP